MNFWKSVISFFEVELTSSEPECAISAINDAGINIFQIRRNGELTRVFRIYQKDFPGLSAICQKRGESLKIVHRTGILWNGKSLIKRPVLMGGILLFLLMVFFLPTRILFVRVEGNRNVPSKKIYSAANACGICFGASRREVRSEKIKNNLLFSVPELQWAGVNTYGCVAVISVRERVDAEEKAEDYVVSNIVANQDGYILSGTVTQGTGLFSVGKAVKAGQILISGYTDCGLCIRANKAEGDILAQTKRDLEIVMPLHRMRKKDIGKMKRKYSLILRKKRINLWKDSGILEGSCGRMYEEYYITLPGEFQLPIALCIETFSFYKEEPFQIELEEAEKMLSRFAEHYLASSMIAGRIWHKVQDIYQENECYHLSGKYICAEMIGRLQQEQIGDIYGKAS